MIRWIVFIVLLFGPPVLMALVVDGVIKQPRWLDLNRFPFGPRVPTLNALSSGFIGGGLAGLLICLAYWLTRP